MNHNAQPHRQRTLRALVLVFPVWLALGLPRVARAQEPEPQPSAVVVPPEASKVAPSSEPDQPLAKARLLSAAGDRLFVAGHYAAALAEYSRAYDILDGHAKQYWVLH